MNDEEYNYLIEITTEKRVNEDLRIIILKIAFFLK